MRLAILIVSAAISSVVGHQPYLINPYQQFFRYGLNPYYNSLGLYASHYNGYAPFVPTIPYNFYTNTPLTPYLAQPYDVPTLNVMAEVPYSIKNKFTVVPMFAIQRENFNVLSNALIIQVSKEQPTITVKNEEDVLVQCTPAVKVILNKPIFIYSLKSSIIFPSEIEIVHGGLKLPIQVGAVIAPINQDTYVSAETPVPINVVYAVPTKPLVVDLLNEEQDTTVNVDTQAVIIDTDDKGETLPPKNITVLDFPETEAEPTFQVDEEDEELVNRNPPVGVVPAGIVQSTQPIASIQQFQNSKESSLLTTLREEAAKDRIKVHTVASLAKTV